MSARHRAGDSTIRPLPWRAAIGRTFALAVLWWVLTEGSAAWAAGLLVVPAAVLSSLALARPHARGVRVLALLRFIPFFLWQSVRGGIDVARRALGPRLSIAPALFDYPLRLADPRERALLANVLSLVPGTVSAELLDDRLRLHVLDVRLPVERTVREVESRVAAIFGDRLQAPRGRREG